MSSNDVDNRDLNLHVPKNHEENVQPHIELLQKKVEELESDMIKEKRNSNLKLYMTNVSLDNRAQD